MWTIIDTQPTSPLRPGCRCTMLNKKKTIDDRNRKKTTETSLEITDNWKSTPKQQKISQTYTRQQISHNNNWEWKHNFETKDIWLSAIDNVNFIPTTHNGNLKQQQRMEIKNSQQTNLNCDDIKKRIKRFNLNIVLI